MADAPAQLHHHGHAGDRHAGHDHVHPHHGHRHAPGTPHPAQAPHWSLIRSSLSARIAAAALVAAGLWALVAGLLRAS
jgi:hypothetical protein